MSSYEPHWDRLFLWAGVGVRDAYGWMQYIICRVSGGSLRALVSSNDTISITIFEWLCVTWFWLFVTFEYFIRLRWKTRWPCEADCGLHEATGLFPCPLSLLTPSEYYLTAAKYYLYYWRRHPNIIWSHLFGCCAIAIWTVTTARDAETLAPVLLQRFLSMLIKKLFIVDVFYPEKKREGSLISSSICWGTVP